MPKTTPLPRLTPPQLAILKVLWERSEATVVEIHEALRCPAEGVYRMLEYLREHGGIERFLGNMGLSVPELRQLRARLRED